VRQLLGHFYVTSMWGYETIFFVTTFCQGLPFEQ
jgi:hypothetical protein